MFTMPTQLLYSSSRQEPRATARSRPANYSVGGEIETHGTPATGPAAAMQPITSSMPIPTVTKDSNEKAFVYSDVVEPAAAAEPTEARPVTIRSILNAQILYPILNYAFLAFTDQCTVVLLPLMYSSSIGKGGLGFSSLNIGVIQGITGVTSGLIQIFSFPWFRRRFGNKRLYIGSYAWFLFYVCCFPLLAFLATRAGRADGATWAVIVLQNASYAATNMTWGASVHDTCQLDALITASRMHLHVY